MSIAHERLERYLSNALAERVTVSATYPLLGGIHRNLLVTTETARGGQFVLRIAPPAKKQLDRLKRRHHPYDLAAEFRTLQCLAGGPLRTPWVCGLDLDGDCVGTPCFLMEYIHGATVLQQCNWDRAVVEKYVQAICKMNALRPPAVARIPSVERLSICQLWEELEQHNAPVSLFNACELLERLTPLEPPVRAFTNGDLGPANFVVCDDGGIGIVDWEFAAYTDPLTELSLLYWWPPDMPFADRFKIDQLYCSLRGYDYAMLRWYRLTSALYGWLQAVIDGRPGVAQSREDFVCERLAEHSKGALHFWNDQRR